MHVKAFTLFLILSPLLTKSFAQNSGLTQSASIVCVGEPIRLTANGCDKTVMWSNGMRGTSIIDTVLQNTTYTAACMEGENIVFSFDGALNVQAIPKPRTPYLMCNNDIIKHGRSAKIKTFGCVGTVHWSNGKTGREIKVKPETTTTYTATCKNATNCSAEPISRTIIVYKKKSDLQPNVTWRYGCNGESVLMSADGCTAGTYVWYKHELVLGKVSKTEEISRGASALVTAGGDDIFYTARCQFLDCLGDESNRLQLAFLKTIDTPEVTKSLAIIPGSQTTVDLNSALTKPMTTGGVFEFRKANDTGAPLITDPTKIDKAGTYYVRERSREGNCVSSMAKITIIENVNGQGSVPQPAETSKIAATSTVPTSKPSQFTQSTDTGAEFISAEPNDELDFLGIPGGFSPNGDNINDLFFIKNLEETKASLRIYNRFGHLVYYAPKYENDWDGKPNMGTSSGSAMGLPDGTYYYSIKLEDGRQKISFLTIAR